MIDNIELQELPVSRQGEKSVLNKRDISLCGHVKVDAEILLGKAELTIEELFSLKQGSVVTSIQSIDEPMSLVVNGKVVAVGMIVVIEDKFGFEIMDIIE